MYLCKNGVGVMMKPLEQRDEHTFILRNVSVQDSGNYSCVYSPNKYILNNVRASGQKTVHIQVTDDPPDFREAEIFGPPHVKVGENIELKCIIFERSNSSDKRHMYLCKNGVGVRMEPLGKRDEYTFILKNVAVRDSGSYSCVYSLNKYSLNNVRASGQKTIQVQVTGKRCDL
ncbi:hypothetical protein NFI96_025337 [Prochilodus magdalenae]|nr:hypothetical protein NFI96_025337 [Prochilodus magdalenae]